MLSCWFLLTTATPLSFQVRGLFSSFFILSANSTHGGIQDWAVFIFICIYRHWNRCIYRHINRHTAGVVPAHTHTRTGTHRRQRAVCGEVEFFTTRLYDERNTIRPNTKTNHHGKKRKRERVGRNKKQQQHRYSAGGTRATDSPLRKPSRSGFRCWRSFGSAGKKERYSLSFSFSSSTFSSRPLGEEKI